MPTPLSPKISAPTFTPAAGSPAAPPGLQSASTASSAPAPTAPLAPPPSRAPALGPSVQPSSSRAHAPAAPAYASPPTAKGSPLLGQVTSPGVKRPLASADAESQPAEARRTDHARVRASVACEKCRRSKTKCVNRGVESQCEACKGAGKTCTYPPAAPLTTSRRVSASVGESPSHQRSAEIDVSRKRPRKHMASTPHTYARSNPDQTEDPLDSPFLTPDVWTELFGIYEQHWAADLPFLHAPTFLKPVQQLKSQSAGLSKPALDPMVLLAFLTLTASFHKGLVEYYSPDAHDRKTVTDMYYKAARARLGNESEFPKLERIQTLVMLGMYEWSCRKGVSAWLSIGSAIRSAQQLGLHVALPRDMALSQPSNNPDRGRNMGMTKEDKFIEEEIRRRTFWACFIMDRTLCGGVSRPPNILLEYVSIQLPCSESAFRSGQPVRTCTFSAGLVPKDDNDGHESKAPKSEYGHGTSNSPHTPEDAGDERWETGHEEGMLCHYIRAMEAFRLIIQWSLEGGRRSPNQRPPWEKESFLKRHETMLDTLAKKFPRELTYSAGNINYHCTSRTSTTYTLIHIVHLLCVIILHREYIPFVALDCRNGPQGPLDEPTFPVEKYGDHADFWKESATKLFRASRQLTELLFQCQEWGSLVETPLSMFATYQVTWCSVYWLWFKWMDPEKEYNESLVRKELDILKGRTGGMALTGHWWDITLDLDRFYRGITTDFIKARRAMESASDSSGTSFDTRHLSLREGGCGGGLEEYLKWELKHKEFGNHRKDSDGGGDLADRDADVKGPDYSDAGDTDPNMGDEIMAGTPESLSNGLTARRDARQELRPNFTAINDASPAVSNGTNGLSTRALQPALQTNPNHPPAALQHPGDYQNGGFGVQLAPPQFDYPPYAAPVSASRETLNIPEGPQDPQEASAWGWDVVDGELPAHNFRTPMLGFGHWQHYQDGVNSPIQLPSLPHAEQQWYAAG